MRTATRRLRSAATRNPGVADLELLTTAQVLALLQIGRTKLWALVREEAFPAFRIGEGRNSSLRYRRTDVLRWLGLSWLGSSSASHGQRHRGPVRPEARPPSNCCSIYQLVSWWSTVATTFRRSMVPPVAC